jgi:hypothetical protein
VIWAGICRNASRVLALGGRVNGREVLGVEGEVGYRTLRWP